MRLRRRADQRAVLGLGRAGADPAESAGGDDTELTANGPWLLNRFRDQAQQRMPGYRGDAGAAADRPYHDFLKQPHGNLKTLSERWHDGTLESWDKVRLPELARFLGFDETALDLGGDWKIRYEEAAEGNATKPAPNEWYQPQLPDAAWSVLAAPQSDIAMYQPRQPVVWRPSFEAIREVDPDRSVVCMAPDAFMSGMEELCQDYGGHFHNTGYMAGWWAEQLPMMMRAADLHEDYHLDAVSLRDFARDFADGYRAVVDTESPVLDEKRLTGIEAWVRRGGVFITTGETGRHTPEKADAWPIDSLTGYTVDHITRHPDQEKMEFTGDQPVFTEADWNDRELTRLGLHLQQVAPDCQDLLRWPDGTVASGLRRIGQGAVVTVGCEYNHSPFLLRQLLAWLEINPLPGHTPDPQILSTHEVSNNGLYDVWVLWNRNAEKPGKSSLVFREGCQPVCIALTCKPSRMCRSSAKERRCGHRNSSSGSISSHPKSARSPRAIRGHGKPNSARWKEELLPVTCAA